MHLAIFASGSGSNAASIIEYFRDHTFIDVALIVTDNPDAGVLDVAKRNQIESVIVDKDLRTDGHRFVELLRSRSIAFVGLAGYLKKVNPQLALAYQERMINIHPALLPKYGGKGMFGMNVHKAVIKAEERESGLTIHFVNEQYDEGAIIKQVKCEVHSSDTAEILQKRILALEHEYYPKVIESLCMKILTEQQT